VRDKNGPVEGLKQEDFQVFDQGKPQKVALFTVASTKAAVAAAAKVPPGIYTNEPQHGGAPIRSVTVVLIDLINTKFSDQAYARAQLTKFLKTLEPQDRVALYLLGNGVQVLHDFSHDPDRLIRAVAKLRGEVSATLPAVDEATFDIGIPMFTDLLSRTFAQIQDFYTIDRAKTTLVAMEAIGNHLMRLPGRKNLVWISGSFPFTLGLDGDPKDISRDKRNFSVEAERASRALSNANVSIYPVDARGLIIGANVEPTAEPTTLRYGRGVAVRNIPLGHDSMEILAERTGGRAFYNTNDIRGAIRDAPE
jgi:VWFA-related protein